MYEKESGLFRKSTLERVSSPEQLNEYIKVTNPSLIVMLLGIFTILIAGGVWIFTGSIPKTVDFAGVVVGDSANNQKLYCYVPIGTRKRLTENMDVQISPDYAERTEYGYLKGRIQTISDIIVTEEYLSSKFENPRLVLPAVASASQKGNVVEVEVSLGEWSNEKGKEIEVMEGTSCVASAIVSNTKPYQLIFNN